ncbi:MAG: 4-(cytidine 5'-diphospho)-2-C-methyl-D-erythritol kinase [Elusimicrobia bacterium]|nr:4-(cytidine 5'-diphospho)-2-C-methyl-D-erythritol kinase [Elusimicrobiota bacterium]
MTAVPRAVTLASPAKINLFLEIVNRRPDGYHTLSTLFQEISLCDTLRARVHSGRAMTMSTDDPALRTDDTNLVLRAARAFQHRFPATPGLHFSLTKRIPIGAGLGGGSGNAATALRMCADLIPSHSPREPQILLSLAQKLGADVPFFLQGGLSAAGGVGDRLTPLRPAVRRSYFYVLVFPGVFSSTPDAYRALRFPLTNRRSRLKLTRALNAGAPPDVWAPWLFNRLEDVVLPRLRPVGLAKKALIQAGCMNALMSGSGSSVFGVVENAAHGRRVMALVRRERWEVWGVSSGAGHGK